MTTNPDIREYLPEHLSCALYFSYAHMPHNSLLSNTITPCSSYCTNIASFPGPTRSFHLLCSANPRKHSLIHTDLTPQTVEANDMVFHDDFYRNRFVTITGQHLCVSLRILAWIVINMQNGYCYQCIQFSSEFRHYAASDLSHSQTPNNFKLYFQGPTHSQNPR